MTNEIVGIPLWVWIGAAVVIAVVVAILVGRAVSRWRRSRPAGGRRQRLTPAPFRVFLTNGSRRGGRSSEAGSSEAGSSDADPRDGGPEGHAPRP